MTDGPTFTINQNVPDPENGMPIVHAVRRLCALAGVDPQSDPAYQFRAWNGEWVSIAAGLEAFAILAERMADKGEP